MMIAVIPARAGSKRIPQKNIKLFCGKPIIAYSIEAALASGLFDEVIVSTDSHEIAEVAKDYGASIPFFRPENLADDFSTTGQVMAHTVDWFQRNKDKLDSACCIYATAPMIMKSDLVGACEVFRFGGWDFVFSATKFLYPIQRGFKKTESNGLVMFNPEHFNTRSQDLTQAYHDAGQFYFGTPDAWIDNSPLFCEKSTIYELPFWRTHDIDTPEDWKMAEILYKIKGQTDEL
jgi:pseudaminic acid cytidylyltransferase